jgi:hypothetical protein
VGSDEELDEDEEVEEDVDLLDKVAPGSRPVAESRKTHDDRTNKR